MTLSTLTSSSISRPTSTVIKGLNSPNALPSTGSRIGRRPASANIAARRLGTAATPERVALNESAEARGFALYVGLDEVTAAAAGISLATVVEILKQQLHDLVPGAQSHVTVALAPRGVGGRNVDVVRHALRDGAARSGNSDPGSVRRSPATSGAAPRPQTTGGASSFTTAAATTVSASSPVATSGLGAVPAGVVIDLSRFRVLVAGQRAPLTYKEFNLLEFLIARQGETVSRETLVEQLWSAGDLDAPNARTIDVYIRRLRAKLGEFGGIIRTVRGAGYRFDHHADVTIYGNS